MALTSVLCPARGRAEAPLSSLGCADNYALLGDRRVRSLYFAHANSNLPLSFGYEIEFHPRESPRLLDFYRVIGTPEAEWAALAPAERLARAEIAAERAGPLKAHVLEKNASAPDFLSRFAIKEADGRLELSAAAPSENLRDTFRQLDDIWATIGPGSVQGHVAFESLPMPGAEKAVKLNFDLRQMEALHRGYERYLQDGSPPGKNLAHHSLGPINEEGYAWMAKELKRKTPRDQKAPQLSVKNTYTVAYRPDLYGEGKIGFEVRNCHKRLDCLKETMIDFAELVERRFRPYASLDSVGPLPDYQVMRKLPPEQQRLFLRAAELLKRTHSKLELGARDLRARFSLPELAWEDHPFVRALGPDRAAEFRARGQAARQNFEARLAELAHAYTVNERLVEELQTAVAKWAYESGIYGALKEGRDAFLAARGLANARPVPLGEEERRALRDLLVPSGRVEELAVYLNGESNVEELVRMGRDASAREKGILYTNLEHAGDFAPRLVALRKAGGASLFRDIAFSRDAPQFLDAIFAQGEPERSYLLRALARTGARTSLEHPLGGRVRALISELPSEKLREVLRAARAEGVEAPEFAELMGRDGFLLSDYARDPEALRHLRALFSDRDAAPAHLTWLANELAGHFSTDADQGLLLDALLSRASEVRALGNEHALVKLGGRPYVLEFKGKYTRLRPAETYGAERLAELRALERAGASGEVILGPVNLAQIARDPEGVYVTSKMMTPSIGHQSLLLHGTLYSLSSDGIYTQAATPAALSEMRIIKLRASPAQRQALGELVERRAGEAVDFVVHDPKPGQFNCTNWIACDLEAAKIISFPDEHTKGDAVGQSSYLLRGPEEIPEVERVYLNERYERRRRRLWLYPAGFGALGLAGAAASVWTMLTDGEPRARSNLTEEANLLGAAYRKNPSGTDLIASRPLRPQFFAGAIHRAIATGVPTDTILAELGRVRGPLDAATRRRLDEYLRQKLPPGDRATIFYDPRR